MKTIHLPLTPGIDYKAFTVRRKYEVRQIRELKKNKKWSDEYEPDKELLEDHDIRPMREPFTKEFFQRFGMAFRIFPCGFIECWLYLGPSCNNELANRSVRKQQFLQTLILH